MHGILRLTAVMLMLRHPCIGAFLPLSRLVKARRESFLSVNWGCCTDPGGDGRVFVEPNVVQANNGQSYKLGSPREWLEYSELLAGNGAYTVLRCDAIASSNWKMWGLDFHLARIRESFLTVSDLSQGNLASAEATETTKLLVYRLLEKGNAQMKQCSMIGKDECIVFMVTILWQPTDDNRIKVTGHIFSGMKVTSLHNMQLDTSVDAVLGISDTADDYMLPRRYDNFPMAKQCSWCRLRRPLEQKFQRNGSEVILVERKANDECYLLEGLTSNVFVVYKDGHIRTERTDYVLNGYVRQKLLEGAATDPTAIVKVDRIPLSDVHLWREVFCTSSVRLIYPISSIKVLTSVDAESEPQLQTVWKSELFGDSPSVWSSLYTTLMRDTYENQSC